MRLPHPFLQRIRTRAEERRCADYVHGRRNAIEVTTVATYLAAETFLSLGAATFLTSLALSTAVSFGVNAVFAKRPDSSGFNQEAQDRLLTVNQPAASHDIVFGEVRKGGGLALIHSTHTPEEVLTSLTFRGTIPYDSPFRINVSSDEDGAPAAAHRDAVAVRITEYNRITEEYDRTSLTEVGSSPASGEYSVNDATGAYTFNAAQAGRSVQIVYKAKAESKVSRYLHLLVALAGHQCEEIGDMYFDGKLVPLDSNGEATGFYAGHVFVNKHLGTDSQTVDAELQRFMPSWPATARGQGVCYAYVRLLRNLVLFPNGVPNITFMVKGYQPYDPRTAASTWTPNVSLCTSGYLTNTRFGLKHSYANEIDEATLTASANVDDEEVLLSTRHPTAEFTANASTDAIYLTSGNARLPQTGDGLRFTNSGGGLPAGLSAGTTYYARRVASEGFTLHTTLAGAYANTGKVNITSAGTGTHTLVPYSEPRYTANGVISTSEKKLDILGRLKAARMGHIVRVGGKWKIRGGAYIATELSFDEDGARGDLAVQTLRGRRESFNGVKGLYSSPDNEWQPSDFPPVQVAEYVTADDDEERWFEIDLPLTSRTPTARRIAKALLERVRRQISATYPMKLGAYRVEAPETVELSDTMLGWTDKVFEVAGGSLVLDQDADGNPILGVDWRLEETDENVWDWDPEEHDEPTERSEATSLPNPYDVAPPGNPSVSEELYETMGGHASAAKAVVSWAPAPDAQVSAYDFEWQLEGATSWNRQHGIVGVSTEVLDIAPGIYLWRVRSVNSSFDGSSDWAQTRKEIKGLNERPSTPVILGIQAHGNGALLIMEPATELDVRIGGKWLVRHSEDALPTWENSVSIGERGGYPGGNAMLAVPLKPGVYFVKKQDSGGRRSETAAEYTSVQPSLNTYSPLLEVTLEDEWADPSHSHDDTIFDAGVLKLRGAGLFDDIEDFDSISSLDDAGGVEADGTWLFLSALSFGGGTKKVRITSSLTAETVNVNDSFDNRIGDVDDWEDFDGPGGGGSCDAWVEVRTKAGPPSEYARCDAGEFELTSLIFRMQLRSDDPAYNIHLSAGTILAEEII